VIYLQLHWLLWGHAMKLKLALCAHAAALCVLVGAIPAGASTIEIGLATGSGPGSAPGAISPVATGTGAGGVVWGGSYDNYLFNLISASDPSPINLQSGTLDVTLPSNLGGAKDAIYVYVTETGLTSSQSTLNFTSSFDVENLPTGWSETERTYIDNTDTAFGTNPLNQLSSMSGAAGSKTTTTNGVSVASTFSITEVYEIISNGLAGTDISTESVQASGGGISPAPAPAIGAGIPGLLAVGGVLLAWKLFERRRQA
jgi:hypothetical protein